MSTLIDIKQMWQPYAVATAAAFVRTLLNSLISKK